MGYSPILGRFLQRDPMGDPSQLILSNAVGSMVARPSHPIDLISDLTEIAPSFSNGNLFLLSSNGGRLIENESSILALDSDSSGLLGVQRMAEVSNLYLYALDNPVRYVDPSGAVTTTSSYSPPTLAGACFGSCKCTGIPNFKGIGWAVIDLPNAIQYSLSIAAAMGLATKACGLETCNACSLGANPATQPVRQTACVQAAMRATSFGNPAITCVCT